MDTNNDKEDRYKAYRRDRDAEAKLLDYFRDPNSPLKLVIVTAKLLTGFDAPILQAMYLDKPMKDHNLLQAICRTNRTYDSGKSHGLIVDYIGIRDNMREAMKLYGGDTSVAPSADDVEQATEVFREHMEVLKDLFKGYDLTPFLDPEGDPALRYKLLAKAAEYVFISTQELNTQNNDGKSVQNVSFKTYFLVFPLICKFSCGILRKIRLKQVQYNLNMGFFM